jgi:hypothetical protein
VGVAKVLPALDLVRIRKPSFRRHLRQDS